MAEAEGNQQIKMTEAPDTAEGVSESATEKVAEGTSDGVAEGATEGTTEGATEDKKGGAAGQKNGTQIAHSLASPQFNNLGAWYEKPESLGNTAGDKIESALSPVGKHVGTGFEYATRPVGGLVDGVLGGVMKSGEVFGETIGVGYGNKDGGPAKAAEKEGERMKEPIGGKEQTADNPLGL